MQRHSLLRRLAASLPTPPSPNYTFHRPQSPYDCLPPRAKIVDIGCQNKRGSYVFGPPPPDAHLICVDLQHGPGVDVVADAHNLGMLEDETIDCVLFVSVLPHLANPRRAIREAHRILKPGGVFYASAPFLNPFQPDPIDLVRYTRDGLAKLCEDFQRIEHGYNRGPASTMHELTTHFLALLFSFNVKRLFHFNYYVVRWLFFWIKYLDVVIARFELAHVIHTGAFFLGVKPRK